MKTRKLAALRIDNINKKPFVHAVSDHIDRCPLQILYRLAYIRTEIKKKCLVRDFHTNLKFFCQDSQHKIIKKWWYEVSIFWDERFGFTINRFFKIRSNVRPSKDDFETHSPPVVNNKYNCTTHRLLWDCFITLQNLNIR